VKQMALDGIEIAYLDQGEGPIIIAAHCGPASHKEWLPLIEKLGLEWRVLAPRGRLGETEAIQHLAGAKPAIGRLDCLLRALCGQLTTTSACS